MKDSPWIKFLVFTRKERIAAIVLSSLIVITAIAPYFVPEKKFITPAPGEFEAFRQQLEKLNSSKDSSIAEDNTQPWQKNYPITAYTDKNEHSTLFYFDPNRILENDWKKLGLRDRTVKTIMNFRAKGGKFRQATDLKKVYGLRDEEYQRLLPYIKLDSPENKPRNRDSTVFSKGRYESKHVDLIKPHSIEINKADSTELIALPGIGYKLASRIINFRDKLGGFYSVQQISEVYGLPDSTYSKIKDFMICDPGLIKQININTVALEELKQHPYIKWNLANAIVQFRKSHGDFGKLEDLKQIVIMDELLFQKLIPYLRLD
jgi:competence protein ComEA